MSQLFDLCVVAATICLLGGLGCSCCRYWLHVGSLVAMLVYLIRLCFQGICHAAKYCRTITGVARDAIRRSMGLWHDSTVEPDADMPGAQAFLH